MMDHGKFHGGVVCGRRPCVVLGNSTEAVCRWVAAVLVLTLGLLSEGSAVAAEYRRHTGACDASAAAPISVDLMATASDEDNVLRIYGRGRDGPPLTETDVSWFLGSERKTEADIEGAARMGDRVYWIGSHARNEQGQPRPARHVLLATAIREGGGVPRLEPLGRPYRGLVRAMAADAALRALRLGEAGERPPEAPGGLNIEGLAAGEDGSLLIGFRNPVPEGRALIVPLRNPAEVIDRAEPRFGPPRTLALGGLGIRDLARAATGYWVVAGPAEGGGRHRLFHWSGAGAEPVEVRRAIPREFQAEAIVFSSQGGSDILDLLSDDGGMKIAGERCADMKEASQRAFRSLRVEPLAR